MSSRVQRVFERKLAQMPSFVAGSVQYEVITGSVAYGMATEGSDEDVYGFCIPPKAIVFPFHNGEFIYGFGPNPPGFEQWSAHHVKDQEARKEYDLTVYNIVKFFDLTAQCNPNMIDTLFVPQHCVLNATKIGTMVRDNRKLFLSKLAWHKFKGYAYSQMKKLRDKNPEGSRAALVEKFGYDVKYASHLVRLMCEVEQLLETGDMDIQRDREMLKSIRRGEWTEEQIYDYFNRRERDMGALYEKSELPHTPRMDEIQALLYNCLEEAYGRLSNMVERQSDTRMLVSAIDEVLCRYR